MGLRAERGKTRWLFQIKVLSLLRYIGTSLNVEIQNSFNILHLILINSPI